VEQDPVVEAVPTLKEVVPTLKEEVVPTLEEEVLAPSHFSVEGEAG